MQTFKRKFKKILICLLTAIMCLSPILLAGCTSTSDPGGSTIGGGGSSGGSGGSSGGGSSGGGSSGGGQQEEYDPKDYFAGYKFAYRPASGNDKQFIIDVRNQNYQFTLEIMEALYNTYGHAIIYDADDVGADIIACDEDGNVSVVEYGDKTIFKNGTTPTYSKKYFLNLKNIFEQMGRELKITDAGVVQIVNTDDGKVLAQFDTSAEYAQYFSYENAIYKDSPQIGDKNNDYSQEVGDDTIDKIVEASESNNLTYRRWKMSINEKSNPNSLEKAYAAQYFLNNHRFRAKIQFAITLITAGYDISPSGDGRSAYQQGCDYINSAFENQKQSQGANIQLDADNKTTALDSDAEIKKFYEDIEENLFSQYEKWIDHSGYTASEQQQIANYICDDVIGTSLVKRDNNRFVNVYKPLDENAYYQLPVSRDENLKEKYTRYLTDDNLNGAFLSYQADGVYDDDSGVCDIGFFKYKPNGSYGDSTTPESQLQTFMTYLSYATRNADGSSDYEINKDFKFSDPTYSVPEVGAQLFEVYDLNCDGDFYGDKYDVDGNGSYVKFSYEEEAQNVFGNGTEPAMIYSIRLQFFKNYVNTVQDIVISIAEKTTKVENADGEMEDELVYPRIPACAYANYSCGDLLANDDPSSSSYGEMFHMRAGYQNYQNMVFMPKKNVTLNSIWVSFKSNRDYSDPGFEVVVYARYYDATTNSYASWTQNGEETQFYNCGSQTVMNYENGDFDFLEVDTSSILSSAKIGDKEKGNAVLSPFVNPKGMETYYETQIITRSSTGGKYYEYLELPDGNRVCVFNETKVPKSQKSSYFELIFSTALANEYQVSLSFLDFE